MDDTDSRSYRIVLGTFAAVEVLVTFISVSNKSSRPGAWLRFLACIPFAVYGGIAIQSAFKQRYNSRGIVPRNGARLAWPGTPWGVGEVQTHSRKRCNN